MEFAISKPEHGMDTYKMVVLLIIIKITISSIVIGQFKKLLFSTNSLAKLLSDSFLSDSSISQSHSKL